MLLDAPPLGPQATRDHHGLHRTVTSLIAMAGGRGKHASDAALVLYSLCRPSDPVSDFLGSLFSPSFADPDGLRKRRDQQDAYGPLRPRISIWSHHTRHDNLSVTVSQMAYTGLDRWRWAEEWDIDHRIDMVRMPRFGERPCNELLFEKRIGELLHGPFRGETRDDHDYRRLRAMAVVASFWRIVDALARHFDVAIGSHPETVVDSRRGESVLRIVDTVAAHKARIAKSIENFEKDYGHPADRFWSIYEDALRDGNPRLARERAARRLSKSGPVRLVPTTAEDGYEMLKTAIAFRLWTATRADASPPRKRTKR